jgi:hypothetical protein
MVYFLFRILIAIRLAEAIAKTAKIAIVEYSGAVGVGLFVGAVVVEVWESTVMV